MTPDQTADTERLFAAYLAGFNISGEGWNGEYPYGDTGKNPAGGEGA